MFWGDTCLSSGAVDKQMACGGSGELWGNTATAADTSWAGGRCWGWGGADLSGGGGGRYPSSSII